MLTSRYHLNRSQSTALNGSRLKVLGSRNDHLNNLFDEASKQVSSLASGSGYAQALENLILEVSAICIIFSLNDISLSTIVPC